jgi:signal transduction histidine kinase
MSIRVRLLVVLGGLLTALSFAILLLRRAEQEQIGRILAGAHQDARRQMAHWVQSAALPMRQFTQDYAPWRETAEFFAHPDETWARKNLAQNLPVYGLDAIWVLRRNGRLLFTALRNPQITPPALPSAGELTVASAREGPLEFFADTPAGLWHIAGTLVPALPGADPATGGWLLVARQWDAARLEHLGLLSGSRVSLAARDAAPPPETKSFVNLSLPLQDWQARTLRQLQMERIVPDLSGSIEWDGYVIELFVAFALLLLVALWLSVRLWVLQPLDRIGESLATQDPAPIAPLLQRRDEFTRVARLVESSFADRRALEREIAERRQAEAALRASEEHLKHSLELRARLARDLHDTVIQSIYAAGLGLESVRAQLSANPFGAQGRIDHCMGALNETIRQVRRYIGDLEPDADQDRQTFAQAVRALAATMQQLWPVEIAVQLDQGAATNLSAAFEVHALQIVRESISNALRHGAATRIDVSLRTEPPHAVLEVRDNGNGFDPAQRTGAGRGLVNLATRATEMSATLQIESSPGRGARVALFLPLFTRLANP